MIGITRLTDTQLDWAFAVAVGMEVYTPEDRSALKTKDLKELDAKHPVIHISTEGAMLLSTRGKTVPWRPTEDWNQASIIWNRAHVSIGRLDHAAQNRKSQGCVGNGQYEAHVNGRIARAPTHLVALCAATVLDKFGAAIDIPDELA